MIADLREILAIADAGNFAVPAFNVSNMETVVGVMQAAQETRAPVIFQMYTRLFDHPEAPFVARAVHEAMSELKTPAAFHLDHGAGPVQVQRALRLGATGIMLDASVWPLEENISRTAAAVAVCHACGVPVEGELGHVSGGQDEKMGDFTDAVEAEEFVRRAGVAALAVWSERRTASILKRRCWISGVSAKSVPGRACRSFFTAVQACRTTNCAWQLTRASGRSILPPI